MRCGLALAGAQRSFQFPLQALRFLFEALVLFAQPVKSLLRLIRSRLFRTNSIARLSAAVGNRFHPTRLNRSRPFCPAESSATDFRAL
jgi:hypothetical protein